MKYAILEDEPLAAEKLIRTMEDARPKWEHLATLESNEQAKKQLPGLHADLIFVDIHLADGLSFEVFENKLEDIPLIFTTAYDQYALKAFELNSIDYLLKPITREDLERALTKLEKRNGANAIHWEKLMRDLKPSYKDRFLVSTGERIKTIPTSDIAFFYASGKHCFLTDQNGTEYLLDQNLGRLMHQLNPKKFFQINRQFIVHVDYISEMIPYSKSRLKVLMNPPTPEDAIVSVERSPKFKMWVAGE